MLCEYEGVEIKFEWREMQKTLKIEFKIIIINIKSQVSPFLTLKVNHHHNVNFNNFLIYA